MIILFSLVPISHHFYESQVFIKLGFTLVLLASVYALSNKPSRAIIAGILAAPALLGHWAEFVSELYKPHFIQLIFSIVLQTYVTVVMLGHVFRAKVIDRSILYGAVCIYLMVGFIFGSCYSLIETLEPGSFQGLQSFSSFSDIQGTADVFFSSMAITIMSGLTFATILTLIAVPVLYERLLKI